MHIEYPIDFIHKDGTIYRAANASEIPSTVQIGDQHRARIEFWDDYDHTVITNIAETDWIARDALGNVVTQADLPDRPCRRGGWYARRLHAAIQAAERGLPIPGTGKCTPGWTHGYRSVRHQLGQFRQLEAMNHDMAEHSFVHLRHKMRIPARVWDDAPHRRDERCWKSQRRTRWDN